MNNRLIVTLAASGLLLHTCGVTAAVSDQVISEQRAKLASQTQGQGFGPQSPRDLNQVKGNNSIHFSAAPSYSQMNLCNIHFHKNAEHSGGEFTTYAGNGDGKGYQSGYKYNGVLTDKEMMQTRMAVCPSKNGGLNAGDTIELHYVHSTAQVTPGESLAACMNEAIANPQLRVETQVFVLVGGGQGLDFNQLTKVEQAQGKYQAINMLNNMGEPIEYSGSTTGPGYNEKGSPLQVSWRVRPKVAKVNIDSVGQWCRGNEFKEDHAHGVRNLVINPALLSNIN